MPNFEPRDFGIGDTDLSGLIPDTNDPSASPGGGEQPEPAYEFMQCPDDGECCNGLQSNCNLRVNEAFYAVAHNAMSTQESGYEIGYNHYTNLDGALRAGYRGFNLDVCKCGGEISFCHTICGYGDRNPYEVALEIKAFLDKNPTEFVVIVFQYSTGSPTKQELIDVMGSVDGFVERMYAFNSDDQEWPRLRDLLSSTPKKQILAFQHDATDDCSVAGTCPAQLHDYFAFTADTEYQFQNVAAMQEFETSCKVTRGTNGLKHFFNVNSFVTPPNPVSAQAVNKLDFARERLEKCASISGLVPNFITVDFWSEGDLPELVQSVNAKQIGLVTS